MSRKVFTQIAILAFCLLALFGTPASAQAGGVCGGTYYVETGETIESIAQRCGTTVSAIYAANPGLSAPLYTGQALYVPGPNYYNNPPPVNPNLPNYTYIVQPGDTFAIIANRFGVSMYDLWRANPYIHNINLIYVGQVLYIPSPYWPAPTPPPAWYPPPIYWPAPTYPTYPPYDPAWFQVGDGTTTETPEHLSYGNAPGTPNGRVKLVNKDGVDVYVSLQGTTSNGTVVINEYTVDGTMTVKIPAGKYEYVAWVGGKSYSGQFGLSKSSDRTITFYKNKVSVEE